jgi:DNA-directed RNA polymerase subunit RPC12/RpoP
MYAKEISHSCVECFIDEKGEDITTVSNKLLVEKCTPQNTYKIMLFATMLTVEKSLVTTSYKCSSCGKFTLFDLDPSQEIPKNIEQERWYMQDFLSYIKEKINKTGSDTFEHVLRSPVILKNDKNDSSVTIYRMTFTYPTIEDYTKCLKDTKRKDAVDLWVLFDNLERINDFSIPDTQNIKDKYGFDKIFRLKTVELQDIVDRLNEYGVMQNHSYTCRTCGSVETVPFDMTNFFDFLRMS